MIKLAVTHIETESFSPTLLLAGGTSSLLGVKTLLSNNARHAARLDTQKIYDLSKWKAACNANVGKGVTHKAVSKGRLFPSA
jgi:hypothetical protein